MIITSIVAAVVVTAVAIGLVFFFMKKGDNSQDNDNENQQPTSGEVGGYEWVDMGGSVKWATCNLGAETPTQDGDFYMWGSTSVEESCNETRSNTYRKDFPVISGTPEYDAAAAQMGNGWRMPTLEEVQELIDNCTWQPTVQDGVNVFIATSKITGKTLVFPLAGYKEFTRHGGHGNAGAYWTGTPYRFKTQSYKFALYNNGMKQGAGPMDELRYMGLPIRPVIEQVNMTPSSDQPTAQPTGISPDLLFLDLKGDVASVEIKSSSRSPLYTDRTITFDEKGMIVTIDGTKPKLQRDNQGRIIQYEFTEIDDMGEEQPCQTTMKYNSNGTLSEWFTANEYGEWNTQISYNKDGSVKEYVVGDDIETMTVKVKILKTDDHGNWTSRKIEEDNVTESRIIQYRK